MVGIRGKKLQELRDKVKFINEYKSLYLRMTTEDSRMSYGQALEAFFNRNTPASEAQIVQRVASLDQLKSAAAVLISFQEGDRTRLEMITIRQGQIWDNGFYITDGYVSGVERRQGPEKLIGFHNIGRIYPGERLADYKITLAQIGQGQVYEIVGLRPRTI